MWVKISSLTEKFTTINEYDALDRLVRVTDNIGQTARFTYDSRNNLIYTSDPNGKKTKDKQGLYDGKINKDGNTVHYYYDGINRKIKEERDLRKGGQGNGAIDTSNPYNPDGKITIAYTYDKNSHLTAITDDNGNTTQYDYDDSNRLTQQTNADGTTKTFEYDKDSNLVKATDENGYVTEFTYDALNRLTQKDVTRASGVIGTTQQAFEYDGLSRLTKSLDNNNPNDTADDATVAYAYDSLGRLLEEVQNGKAVSSQWDGSNNRLALIYPNGRKIETSYDKLDRIDAIKDSGSAINIVDYDYIGPGRVLERTYSNGMRMTFLDDKRTKNEGYDKARRLVKLRHLTEDNDLVAGFEHGYDRVGNKLYETRLHEFSGKKNVGDVYTYDSVYRLTTFNRDVIDPKKASRSVGRSVASPYEERSNTLLYKESNVKAKSEEIQTEWAFDGLGNWAGLTVGTETFKNSVNEMNEYESFKGQAQTHDDNGNLVDDGTNLYVYDFANRLCKVTRKEDNAVIAIYFYDAIGRRIRKVVSNSGDLNGTTNFYLDGWREIEERDDVDSVLQQYVFGTWIDELLTLDKNIDGDDAIDETVFYHSDGRANISALTDSSGNIIERYTYDAYGQTSIFDSSGGSISTSQISNSNLFSGRRDDWETGNFYYRNRYYSPLAGKFLQRDPLGYTAGSLNLYEYVNGNPLMETDPMGLSSLLYHTTYVELWDNDWPGYDDLVAIFRWSVKASCDWNGNLTVQDTGTFIPLDYIGEVKYIPPTSVQTSLDAQRISVSKSGGAGWYAVTLSGILEGGIKLAAAGGTSGAILGGLVGGTVTLPIGGLGALPASAVYGAGGAVIGAVGGVAYGANKLGDTVAVNASVTHEYKCSCMLDNSGWSAGVRKQVSEVLNNGGDLYWNDYKEIVY